MARYIIKSRIFTCYLLEFVSVFFACVVITENALADSFLEVIAHVEHIENPQRRNEFNDDELLNQVSVRAGYTQETRLFDNSLNYIYSKREYQDDDIQDRDTVTGNGSSTLKIIPDRFSWNVNNSRTLQSIETILPDNPDNRQVVSITSTGPQFSTTFGGGNRVNLQLNYSWADYERIRNFSQTRKAANLEFAHIFSENLIGNIKADYFESDYDIGDTQDFKRKSLSVLGILNREDYYLSLEIGQNEITRRSENAWSNLLIKLDSNYQINTNSKFSLTYSKSGEDLLSNIQLIPDAEGETEIPLLDTVANSNRSQFYELKYGTLSYIYTSPNQIGASIGYTRSSRDYQSVNDDQEDERITLQVTWPVSDKLNLVLFGRQTDLLFSRNNRSQERNEIGFRGNYTLNNSFSFQFSIFKTDQDSNIVQDNYEGLNAYIAVTYRL